MARVVRAADGREWRVRRLWLPLVLPALFLYRIVFRKPWTVQAVARGPEREVRRWKVVGWRRSGEVVDEIAAAIERGMGAVAPPDARAVA